jgi:hypothetical protein
LREWVVLLFIPQEELYTTLWYHNLGINHNIDELLVGVLTQISLRENNNVRKMHPNKVSTVSESLFGEAYRPIGSPYIVFNLSLPLVN